MPSISIRSGQINSRPRINLSGIRVVFPNEKGRDEITAIVSRFFNQPMEALFTRRKNWDICWPRMVAMRLMHEKGFESESIERYFRMSKGTSRYAWQAVGERAQTEPDFRKHLTTLRERIEDVDTH